MADTTMSSSRAALLGIPEYPERLPECTCRSVEAGLVLRDDCPTHAPTCGFCSGSGTVQQLRLDGSADAPRPCGQCGPRAKQSRRGQGGWHDFG